MRVVELLARLQAAGVELWADGDLLRFSAPPGALTPELRAALGEHKSEMLEILRRGSEPADAGRPLAPVPHDRSLPLSLPQRRMWFFEQVHPGTATYHMSACWRIRGALDTAALAGCLKAVAERHGTLRTAFRLDGEEPVQEVADEVEVPLPLTDLTGLHGPEQDAQAARLVALEVSRPFDLGRPPLLRALLLHTGADAWTLVLTVHHIIADMWSVDVLLKEIAALYPGGERTDLPELPVQYADFAVWQRGRLDSGELHGQVEHRTAALQGAPTLLDLPTDRPRPTAATYTGSQVTLDVPADLVDAVDTLCRGEGATRFMAMLAAFHVLLSRYSGESDTLVGVPTANRTRLETENLIGFFVNTLVMRADIADDPTVRELLRRVRDGALDAYEHQDTPVESLVESLHPRRDPARSPLFQAMFAVQNTSMTPLRLAGLDVKPVRSDRSATEFDLTLEFTDPREPSAAPGTQDVHGGPKVSMLYNADVFTADSMVRLLGHWRTLLEGMVAGPDRRVGELPLLEAAESDLVLRLWNSTADDTPQHAVHEEIARQAARVPNAVALAFRDRELTYEALAARSARLAGRLRAAGAGAGQLVAVCVERSPEMVVGLLGVLQSGAAYLPLDPSMPPERLTYILDDAAVSAVVTTRAHRELFAGRQVRLVLVDDEEQAPDAGVPYEEGTPGDALAYAIYTSGSTGRPKGVLVEHGALANFMAAMDGVLGDRADGVWLALTSVSFDIAALELLWPLRRGWKVVIQGEGELLPGAVRKPLDVGLMYFAVSSEEGDPGERYRLLLDGARFADAHGFSAVWTPERHFDRFGGLYPNPAVTAAALAMVTERVALRAGSVVLPLQNPLRVAEEWSVVDNLSGGRVGMAFASGWHADDFALAAGPEVYERRKDVMREGVEAVRRLWRGESVTAVNGMGRETALHTFPRPLQATPPVWLAAAGSPDTFQLAGELGVGVLTHLLGQDLAEVAEKTAVYRKAWREAGHPGEGQVTLMAHTFVGTDSAAVRERVREPFREYLRRSFGLIRALAPSLGIEGEPTSEDVETLLDVGFAHYYDGGALIGTVDECLAMADRIRAAGVDEIACLIDFGVPTDEVLAALSLLDEVRRKISAGAAADYGIAAQIRRHGVTHVQCTPTLAGVLLADPQTRQALAEVNTFLVGGEALTGALAADLAGTVRGRVFNMYGPTETTIWSSVWQVTPGADVTIGDPLANTSLYVLDPRLQPVPLGVPGELWIGGHGVARGYLNRPELTDERFVPSPFVPGDRLYRTGDRVRRRPDGALEFLGRVDRQVKLGGHRIEPGEIEAGLAEHPGVRQAAVVVRDGGAGHRALVGYLVADGPRPAVADLRAHLLRGMPAVMVPSSFVWLDELPLNPSGKVDHHRLPDPADADEERHERTAVTGGDRVALTDPTQRVIAGLWQDVLDVDSVGSDDDFFELGGHSLMAIQMVSRLREALGGEVSLRAVFEAGTVAELARRIREAGPAQDAGTPPLVRRERPDEPVPLSFAQQRMWFFELMNPGVSSYHLSAALRLRGELEPDTLRRAFEEVVRRHEILRTNFDEADGTPVQIVAPHRDVPLPVVDFAGRDEADLVEAAREEARRPFALARDLLLRTTLLRLSATDHVLLLTTHHIVADSWSIGVMAGELGALYDAYRTGAPVRLPELAVQYADFTVWQHEWLVGSVMERQLAFWRQALTGAPPLLALPYDRPRPEVPTHRGEQLVFRLPRETSDGVEALSTNSGVTVFVTLLAAFVVLLHRWAEHERIVLGVPIGGRNQPELEPLIGFFANITVLNIDLTGEPAFAEVLRRVRERVVSGYDHQDLPVEKLVAELGVERTLAYNPLFQVMFVYTNDLALSPAFGGLEVSPVEAHPGHVFMDLNMAMEDGPDGLQGTLDYSSELFDEDTVAWLLDSFRVLLDAAVATPGFPIGDLPLAAPPERAEEDDGALPVVVAATFTAGPVLESLTYWAERTGLPLTVDFAPYDQVFQQLLTPGSAMDRNAEGVNVVLLRPDDWGADAAERIQVGLEFAQALKAFQSGRHTPFVAVLCPGADLAATADWRRTLGANLAQIEDVVCLDMADLLDLYDVGDYRDPVSEAAGNIPYTPEFFAALGTSLVRQLSALVVDAPGVVVLDGDALAAGLEPVRGVLAAVGEALAAQGRQVVTLRTGGRPVPAALHEALAAAGSGAEDCLFISGDPGTCESVRDAWPGAVVVEYPARLADLPGFLEHTWEFDAPGQPVPGAAWWEGTRK